MKKYLEAALKNWKTTLGGLLAFLASVPLFVSSIQAWADHQPTNWRQALIALAFAGAGIIGVSAKDSTTHSTVSEVSVATKQEAAEKEKAALP